MALVAWADLTLCSYTDITNMMSELGTVAALPEEEAAKIEALVTKKRDTVVKARILMELQVKFQERYPNTVQQWVNYAEAMVDIAKQRAQYKVQQSGVNCITPPVGYYQMYVGDCDTDYPNFISTFGVPRTFYFYGVPVSGTSGTYATQAENGAMLVDTRYQRLYINRGTLASPTWEYFIPKDLKDFIVNPEIFALWAAAETIVEVAEDGMFRDRFRGRQDQEDAFITEKIKTVLKPKAKEYKALALQLLDLNPSNNAVNADGISEFSSSSNKSTMPFA